MQRVVLAKQMVATTFVTLSPDGEIEGPSEPYHRQWKFTVAVGGLPGGICAHGKKTAFFPVGDFQVVEVSQEYQNILSTDGQVFLLRASESADVIHLGSQKKVICDMAHFFTALRQQCKSQLRRQAVYATSNHFLMHCSMEDGAKIAAAVRLPDAQAHSNGASVTPTISFAIRWPREHPIARELDPSEREVGDCMMLYGSRYTSPVCMLFASTGDVDILNLFEVPGVPRDAALTETVMNTQRSTFIGILTWKGNCNLAIWHSSGCLLKHLDLRDCDIPRRLQPLQLAVHDRLPLVAVDFGDEFDCSEVHTFLLQFQAAHRSHS